MTEIVEGGFTFMVQNKEVFIALGHGTRMRYVRYHIDAFGYFSTSIDDRKTLTGNHWPLSCDAVQGQTFGEKSSAHGMRGHNDFCMIVDGHEMFQTSGMVAVAVGDKHIVNGAEVDSHLLGIPNQQVAGSRVKQDTVALRFQEYRQPMLGRPYRVVRAIINKYAPLHHSNDFVSQYPNATDTIPNATLPDVGKECLTHCPIFGSRCQTILLCAKVSFYFRIWKKISLFLLLNVPDWRQP